MAADTEIIKVDLVPKKLWDQIVASASGGDGTFDVPVTLTVDEGGYSASTTADIADAFAALRANKTVRAVINFGDGYEYMPVSISLEDSGLIVFGGITTFGETPDAALIFWNESGMAVVMTPIEQTASGPLLVPLAESSGTYSLDGYDFDDIKDAWDASREIYLILDNTRVPVIRLWKVSDEAGYILIATQTMTAGATSGMLCSISVTGAGVVTVSNSTFTITAQGS